MALEEMGAARQGWGWVCHRGLGMKLAVGQQDGYAVVLVGVVGVWPCRAPCGPVPTGPQEPAGPGWKKGRQGRRPAERSSSRSGIPSVRPSLRASRSAARLSAEAAILEVRPSECRAGQVACWPNASAAGLSRSESPSFRFVRLAGPRAGRVQQQASIRYCHHF